MKKAGIYNVKLHQPRQRKVIVGTVILGLTLVCWGIFEYGRHSAGFDSADAQKIYTQLHANINELEDINNDLLKKNASLERSGLIDATARKDVALKLDETNSEIMTLKEELLFYRSLLSPTEQLSGLQILSMQLNQNGEPRSYDYKIFLAHYRGKNQLARGKVSLRFEGKIGNALTTLSLKDISADKKDTLAFSFKNYQKLEGKIILPEKIIPQNIVLRAEPNRKTLKPVEQSYTWQSLIERG